MQADVSVSYDLPVSPDDAFAAVLDWEGQGRWIPLTRTRVLAGAPGVGQRIVARTGVGPLGFDDPMTVTLWDPPRRCEVLHTGRVVRGTGSFIVESAPAGSRFVWEERVLVPGGPLAPLIWPLGRLVTRVSLAFAQRRLARLLERG
jgi:hypothetical protein